MHKLLLLLPLVFSFFQGLGQDTIFYAKFHKIVQTRDSAQYYGFTTRDSKDSNIVVDNKYYLSGKLYCQSIEHHQYSPITMKNSVVSTEFKSYFEDGTVAAAYHFKQNKNVGEFIMRYDNGKLKRNDLYDDEGNLIKGLCLDREGNEITYFPFEVNPSFPGGESALLKYLQENVKYPKKAQKKGQQGRVFVQYIIDPDGNVKNVSIAKGVCEELDKEAMRLIKAMPKWSPGMQDGKPVTVKYTLPIVFKLG